MTSGSKGHFVPVPAVLILLYLNNGVPVKFELLNLLISENAKASCFSFSGDAGLSPDVDLSLSSVEQRLRKVHMTTSS